MGSLSLKGFQLRSEPFELKLNMHITLLFVFGLAIWQAETANIAIPNSQTSCIAEVKFPVKAFKGLTGYPWYTEAFGINVIGTQAAKSKLSHVATVLAELLDNDNDGCVDDPNIMNAMLKQMKDTNKNFAIFVQSEDLDSINF